MYYQIVDDTMYIGSTKWSDDCVAVSISSNNYKITNSTIKHLKMKNPVQDSYDAKPNYIFTINACVDFTFDMNINGKVYLYSDALTLLDITGSFRSLELDAPLLTELHIPSLYNNGYQYYNEVIITNTCDSLKTFDVAEQPRLLRVECHSSAIETLDFTGIAILIDGVGNFSKCTSLKSFKADNVVNYNTQTSYSTTGTFDGCTSLETVEIYEKMYDGKYPNYANHANMFHNCTSLKTYKGNSIYGGCYGMFSGCTSLTTINCSGDWYGNLSGSSMFYNCTSLVGGNGTTYDSSKTDASMAVIDQDGQEGYLTYTKNRDLYNVNIYNDGDLFYQSEYIIYRELTNLVSYSVTDSQHMVADGTLYNIKQTNTSGTAMVGAVVVPSSGLAQVYTGNDISFPVESDTNVYLIRDLPNITLNAIIKAIANPQ